jgi:hypothetical protein
MILGLPRERLPGGIEFDMSAEDEGGRAGLVKSMAGRFEE